MGLQGFHYELPDGAADVPKTDIRVARTDMLSAVVQVVNHGGETNLHAHNGEDAVWMVLDGEVAFYDGEDNRLHLKKHEFVLIPGGTKYWFESVTDEPLQILRFAARDAVAGVSRSNFTERTRIERFGATPKLQCEDIPLIPA
jgi:mannose-6-phosphate isomerase-like protein (cupin superfamily)